MVGSEKQYLTEEKKKELELELEELKTKKRKEIADQLEYARSLGDLSENAEYQEAREAQANLEDRILKLKDILKNAEIIKGHHGGIIDLGSEVVVQKKGGDKMTYTIVGSTETNPDEGKISNESPLGGSMLGKKKGDDFECVTPKGSVSYTIVDVK